MNNDDWLMRQFKGVSNMIGTILNLKVSQLDLGIVEDEEGNLIKGEIYLENLLKSERFLEVNSFIKSKMKVLNFNEYTILIDYYIGYLSSLDSEILKKYQLDPKKIKEIEANLKQFEW